MVGWRDIHANLVSYIWSDTQTELSGSPVQRDFYTELWGSPVWRDFYIVFLESPVCGQSYSKLGVSCLERYVY